MLYVLTFCLPRFFDQPFREKLITVFHELYHVGPAFDGDLRRHPGRYAVHSHSKGQYDSRMAELVKDYLAEHPEPEMFHFLRSGYREKAFLMTKIDGRSASSAKRQLHESLRRLRKP